MQETVIWYSEAFKLKVVTELENGKLDSMEHARRKYGIKGTLTIRGWLKKYGREHLLPRQVRIEMPNEQDQIKKLKQENHKLKLALADAKVGEVLNQALLFIDIDQFRKFNNRYGHLAGDRCLHKVAQVLADHTRRSADLAARFGGEEFILLLPETERSSLVEVAESIRVLL